MGRSVATHPHASQVVFIHLEEDEDPFWWDDLVDNVAYAIRKHFPSMEEPAKERWEGRECRVILENNMGFVTISGYGNVAAVCLVPEEGETHYPDEASMNPLRLAWCERANFHQCFSGWRGLLRKVGSFSNGEAVYKSITI